TVFNYFPTKEALVLDEDEAFAAHLKSVVTGRPSGTSAIEAVRRDASAFLQSMKKRHASSYRKGGMPYLIINNVGVRRAWLAACERTAGSVASALVSEGGGELSPAAADIIATSLVSVFRVILDEVGSAVTAGDDVAKRLNALRPQIEEGLGW